MAQDLQKGETFADGQLVTASRLNNLADLATILAGFISDKSPISPNPASDYVVVYQGSTSSLKKSLFQGGVNSVALTMPTEFTVSGSPVTTTGTLIVTKINQSDNKFYASPADGSEGAPTFRAIGTRDFARPVTTIAASAIDWNLGITFFKFIVSNTVFNFTNATDGMEIKVVLTQSGGGGHTVTWPAGILWQNNTKPVLGTANGWTDMYTFQQVSTSIIGTYVQHLGIG